MSSIRDPGHKASSPKPAAGADSNQSQGQQIEQSVHYTVFIRLPFPRGTFVDPPLVEWDAAKDEALWQLLFRNPQGSNLDWKAIANEFQVTLPFILQQAAWLYERQLSQVRAQMRRVGHGNDTAALQETSPAIETHTRRESR